MLGTRDINMHKTCFSWRALSCNSSIMLCYILIKWMHLYIFISQHVRLSVLSPSFPPESVYLSPPTLWLLWSTDHHLSPRWVPFNWSFSSPFSALWHSLHSAARFVFLKTKSDSASLCFKNHWNTGAFQSKNHILNNPARLPLPPSFTILCTVGVSPLFSGLLSVLP